MPEILSNSFKTDITRLFIDDIANNNYFLYVSGIDSFDPSDSQKSKNEFLERTLFGKKIEINDIHFMIKYYPWQVGQVYVEYDDQVDLTDQRFYAVVGPNDNETGDYRVYKCLNNNSGAAVTSPPNYNPTTTNQVYETADGYVWKFMYVISDLQFEAYNALGYVPIIGTFNTNPPYGGGSRVSDIVVENNLDNSGYVKESGGLISSPFTSGTMLVDPFSTWSPITNYYVGQNIYTLNANGVANLFTINYYNFNTTTGNAEIRVGNELIYGKKTINVEGVTTTNPVVVTATAHGLVDGTQVRFSNVGGTTELNSGVTYYAVKISDDTFSLKVDRNLTSNLDGSAFTAYTSGGTFTAERDAVAAGVASNASFTIFPRVKITGDGNGAVAIPEIVDNRISRVTVLEQGSGYRNALCEVVDPAFDFDPEDTTTTDVRATVRPRLSPDSGHGYNLLDEFRCKHFSFYAYISADDNTRIGDTNTYSGVGIVRSPSFASSVPTVFDNRISVTTNDIDRLTANSTVTQVNSDNEITFSGKVHEIDASANTFYIAEYMGPYQNNADTGQGDTSLDLTLPFRNEAGQTITINSPVIDNVVTSDYTQRTGEVYFMEDFFPLARTELSREEFKFVLEF